MTRAGSPPEPSRSRGLSPRSRRLRTTLLATHVWEPYELEWLQRALEQHDLADECSAVIAREGLVVEGKAHPLLSVRRDALQTGARYWRQLRFAPSERPPRRVGRPGGEAWRAAQAAAQIRRFDAEA